MQVGFRETLTSIQLWLVPRRVAALFALDPLVFADLLFNEVGDPVEGVGLYPRRNRDVLLDF
jgi:hypothetical protein